MTYTKEVPKKKNLSLPLLQGLQGEGPPWTRYVFHLLVTLVLFSPVLYGRVIAASSDNTWLYLPLLELVRDNFNQGFVNGWLPGILAGINVSQSHLNDVFYPFNWPIFLAPKSWFYPLLTLKAFVEVLLTGVMAYHAFLQIINDRRWALWASLLFQGGSFLWFILTINPYASQLLWWMVAHYLALSLNKRHPLVSVLGIALSLGLLMSHGNPVWIAYMTLAFLVGVLGHVSLTSQKSWLHSGLILTSTLAGTVALLPRLLALLEGIRASHRVSEGLFSIQSLYFMAPRLFLPEAYGVSIFQSPLPRINSIFSQSIVSLTPKNTFAVFFSALAAYVVMWGLARKGDAIQRFWKIYLVVALLFVLAIQPLAGLINILLYPGVHTAYILAFLPIPFCIFAGLSAQEWEKTPASKKSSPWIFWTASVVLATCVVLMSFGNLHGFFGIKTYGNWILLLKVLIILTPLLLYKFDVPDPKNYWVLSLFALGLGLLLCWTLWGAETWKTVAPWSALLMVSLYISTILKKGEDRTLSPNWILGGFGVVCLVYILIPAFPYHHATERAYASFSVMGMAKFVVVSLLAVLLLGKKDSLPKKEAGLILILVSLAEMMTYSQSFRGMTSSAYTGFSLTSPPYPERSLTLKHRGVDRTLDQTNFRSVGAWNQVAPYHGPTANVPAIYGYKMAGGEASIVKQRYAKLVEALANIDFKRTQRIQDDPGSEKLLDLAAVRYRVNKKEVLERRSSLARFMFYTRAHFLPDHKVLPLLKTTPYTHLLLISDPLQRVEGEQAPGRTIPITLETPHEIRGTLVTDRPGFIMLADNYDPAWKLLINGREAPILHANYAFMGARVPAGELDLRFIFDPSLPLGWGLSLALGLGTCLAGGLFFTNRMG